jgi:hypothetical protein
MSGEGSEDHFQVTSTVQQHPVQALCPDRANPPLCEGVRSGSPDRGLTLSHRKTSSKAGELGIPVPDKEPDRLEPLPHRQVASLLGHPRRVGVLRDPEDVHPARPNVDGEEHEHRLKQDRFHREEVQREDPLGLRPEELAPGRTGPARGRTEAVPPQQRADRSRRDPDAELGELALDPHGAPPRVLPSHPEDQLSNLTCDRRPSADGPSPEGPLPLHEVPVPAKERLRTDEER